MQTGPLFWGTVAAWAGSLGTFLGLIIVALQVRQAQRTAYGQFVHELDKDYRGYFNANLGDDAEEEDTPQKLLERIFFFEKVKTLLDQKVIKMSTIDVLFAGRFFHLAHSERTHRALYNIRDHAHGFFALHAQWVAYRRKTRQPIPRNEHNLVTSPLFGEGMYQAIVLRGKKLSK